MGLKKAAVARLCLNGDIYRAMPEVCDKYLPGPAPGYPVPPPVPTRYGQAEASGEQPYTGGDIWLVEGATGKNRLCNDYDVAEQRCRVWAHTVHRSAPKKKAAVRRLRRNSPPTHVDAKIAATVPTASRETSHTAASPAGTRRGGNKGIVTMKNLLMSVAFIALVGSIVPAVAPRSAIGGGANW